ncbi:MAG: phosphoethanolamine--lipid A transferase [Burkholderiaceae bacterium]|nr:phosphoethanolamine--lipid A transferase [Burkholderiaceae bacterium]
MKAISRPHPAVLSLMASTFIVIAYNFSFWRGLINATGGVQLGNIPLYMAVFLILVLFFNAIITLVTFRPVIKPLLTVLFCVTSVVAYFMDQYGTAIDAAMIQNVFETNTLEAIELISWRMVLFFLLLGVLPSLLLWRAELNFPPIRRDLSGKLVIVAASLVVAVGLLLAFYKSFAPTFREHRELRFFLAPLNYIQATNSYVKRKFSRPLVVAPLGTDASKGILWKGHERKTVTVIVLGETARAMNFSLNGYQRNTNPELSQQNGLINFTNVQSCGTATAVSVPCLFSNLGRADYSETQAKSQEGMLDVLSHAGFGVLWRNNNSGCKGTCDRVEYEDFSKPVAGDPLCTTEECYDEYMLKGLPERIRSSQKDMVIVLHQKGSHGPAYWKRYPEAFKRFGPVCETNELQKCSSESIVAAYDNSILYTDHFISKVIDMLRKIGNEDKFDTSLVYFSDHGESLGESGMYLHGAPYMISPVEQRHVPFMVWLSDGFRSRFRIDTTCLAARSNQSFSHDNVFHSTLGMLNVNTAVYNPKLDIFQACSRASMESTRGAGV